MKNNEKEAEEIYMQLQMIEQSLKTLQRQAEILDSQFVEMSMTSSSISDFVKLKEGSELLVPLGPGLYAEAELRESKELIINIGADVAVKKSAESAKELIDAQINQIKGLRAKIASDMEKTAGYAEQYQSRLQKLLSEPKE